MIRDCSRLHSMAGYTLAPPKPSFLEFFIRIASYTAWQRILLPLNNLIPCIVPTHCRLRSMAAYSLNALLYRPRRVVKIATGQHLVGRVWCVAEAYCLLRSVNHVHYCQEYRTTRTIR